MPRVAVVDYGMGNLHSVAKALEAAGANAIVTAHADAAEECDGLCVPGQGIFGRCMSNLALTGFTDLISDWIEAGRPYLGICLGLQVLFSSSEEGGGCAGLGILEGVVTKLPGSVTVPHIGWNTVGPPSADGSGGTYYYFDHSYAVHPGDDRMVTGWCTHGDDFAARVETRSILGVQFHPEKSGDAGIELLRGWVKTL